MFNFLRKTGSDALKRISGRTDILEAGAAIAARVAAASAEDGQPAISDEEIANTYEAMTQMEQITSTFTDEQIQAAINKQFQRAKNPMGRVQLKKEVADIKNHDEETKILIFMIGVMAASSGGIDAKERNQLLADARLIGLSEGTANELIAA